MGTKVTEHYFEYGAMRYFRGNAHLVVIGTYGEKKDPIGVKAYLDEEDKVSREHLKTRVEKGYPVSVNFKETTQAELEVNGPLMVFGLNVNVAAEYNYGKTQTADLRLFNLSIPAGKLETMLNDDAHAARNFLAEEGKDGRIVSEVWVVMEAELAEHFNTSGGVALSVMGTDLSMTAKGGTHGTQTIRLSPGTTFAYKLHKVKKWSKNKTQIEDMEADYKGMS